MKHEPICRQFLESLLGLRLNDLQYVAKQEDLTDSPFYRGNILDFLRMIRGNAATTEFGTAVSVKLTEVRNDKDLMEEYMTVKEYGEDCAYIARQEALAEGMQKGMEQGMQQGMEQGMQQGMEQGMQQGRNAAIRQSAAALQKTGMTVEQIAKVFEISTEELQKILETPNET